MNLTGGAASHHLLHNGAGLSSYQLKHRYVDTPSSWQAIVASFSWRPPIG